jgi:hypothetical protein
MNTQELTSRQIPGITGKQVAAFVVTLVAVTFSYADIKNSISSGKKERIEMLEIMKEMRTDMKQEREKDNVKIQAIELQIRECKIRLDIMEGFIEGYNKPK